MASPSSTIQNPVLKANVLSRMSFWWLNGILGKGYKSDLEFKDIYQVLPKDRAQSLGDDLKLLWDTEVQKCEQKDAKKKSGKKKTDPSLRKAIIHQFISEYMLCGLIGFFEECVLKIAQPILLGYLIKYFVERGKFTELHGYFFATGVVVSSIGLLFTHHIYFLGLTHCGMRVRVACSALIFRKALKLSQSALGHTTIGTFVNMLANDVGRFELAAINCHHFWIGPVQTALATAILWMYLGISCLSGLLALLVLIPLQGYMGKIFSKLRAQTALKTDKRIRIMNEIINGIKVLKMYAWEEPFAETVAEARRDEVEAIQKTSTLRAINTSLFFASSKVIIFFTLLTYVLLGNSLNAEKVFVSLALYNNIRQNMTLHFPGAIAAVAEALVSIRRIEDILLMEEKVPQSDNEGSKDGAALADEGKGVTLDHFSGKWNFSYEENTIADISLSVKAGELLAIVGHVGSGKGSIVQAILKELPATDGNIRVNGSLAYTAQEPWIFAGTVRENILFGKPYESVWYDKVIDACALDRDLGLLPNGDDSEVGDRGSSLSGGQKARINLARAVYADTDIYLLDDPLSAVDAEVGRHIFEKCINGILAQKVRILVTHQLQFLKSLEHIILVNNGAIEFDGNYNGLLMSGIDFAKLLETKKPLGPPFSPHGKHMGKSNTSFHSGHQSIGHKYSDGSLVSGFSIPRHESLTLAENTLLGSLYPSNEMIKMDESAPDSHKIIEDENESLTLVLKSSEETKMTGSLKWSLYFNYFHAGANYCTMFSLVLSNLISQVLFTGADYWLTVWTKHEERNPVGKASVSSTLQIKSNVSNSRYGLDISDRLFEVSLYSAIVAGVFVTSIWRTVLFFKVAIRASINLHNLMLKAVIRAPMTFFEANNVGRILNRFSAAMGEMDDALPTAFFYALGILLNVAGIVILVAILNPILIGPAILLAIILYFLRIFYLHTARSIKRLEGVARSPVYSHLSTTLYGLPTIRAFKAEAAFVNQFDEHMNTHSSAWYLFLTSTRWFGFWLDWISVFFIASVTFSFMLESTDSEGPTVGLIISSVIQMSGILQWGIRQSAEVQNQMISVERVFEYTQITPEADLESKKDNQPPPDWPSEGEIVMYQVKLHYDSFAPPILDNISCVIHPSEKIGIVGRTGAGKSSLITVLFRMAEPEGEIFIDNINILKIGLHDLRLKLAIIPQDPVLFMGSLRKNLDPFNSYPDSKIWDALEQVHLAADVKVVPFGLELEVTEGGANFSVGQRQLVCLARAILKQSKILILDEATANVDPETDNLIQKTIRTKFTNCTVLTIAHRLNTVMDSDRILVLDAGKIKEFDEAFILLEDKETELYHLVQETGEDSAKNLYEMAKASMVERHPP